MCRSGALTTTGRAALTALLFAIVVYGWAAARADAYIYWADQNNTAQGPQNHIGRAKRNGDGASFKFINAPQAWAIAVDSSYIYWTNPGSGTIGRANLDGSGVSTSFITGLNNDGAGGVAVDSGHIYWANFTKIGRANLNGTGKNQSFITGTAYATGVAVDAAHVYWTNFQSGNLGRANLNGSGVNQTFITGTAFQTQGVAVDAGHIYWANQSRNSIGRANLDGTGVTQSIGIGPSAPVPAGLAVDALPAVPQSLPGEVVGSTSWSLRNSLTTGGATVGPFSFGAKPNMPLMGDWDGDGTRTPGSFESGVFKLRNSNAAGPPDQTITFGDARGFPVAGDFDGDGIDDLAVFRAGSWQVRFSDGGVLPAFTFGSGSWPATIPVAGDWRGLGHDGIGIYEYNSATWTLRDATRNDTPVIGSFIFGTPNASYPVPGNWNPAVDDTDTFGVKATAGTEWSLRNSNSAGAADITFDFGTANSLPVVWSQFGP